MQPHYRDASTAKTDTKAIDARAGQRKPHAPMKVHVVWSPLEHSNTFRANAGLCAFLSPDGQQILYIDLQTQRVTLRSTAGAGERPRLAECLQRLGLSMAQLKVLVGEVHLPGGQELGKLILRDVLNVLLLSEEPPGNEPVPSGLPLPLESVNVINQGAAWPGYERASLEPDGDVLVNHVIMASVIPPPPP